MPYTFLALEYFMIKMYIWPDNGCSRDKNKTKSTTMAQYKSLYIGADFILEA